MNDLQQKSKQAKLNYNQFKRDNPARYQEQREQLINQLITSRVPNWGSIRITFKN